MNKQIVRSLTMAGVILAGSIGLTAAKYAGLIDQDTTLRSLMILMGLVMLVYSNEIPKAVIKQSARGQALQRMAARALVLAYLAWLAAWLFAPMNLANGLAMIPVALAAVWIVVACVMSRRQAT